MKTGIELIAEERQRQIEIEGWTIAHDKQEHDDEDLAQAAACCARPWYSRNMQDNGLPERWPWDKKWWKPAKEPKLPGFAGRIRELQKAGALIAAEIDRLNSLK